MRKNQHEINLNVSLSKQKLLNMKNLLKSLLCASLLIISFASCKKNLNVISSSNNGQIEKNTVVNMQRLSGNDRRIAYETLTPAEVKEFWIEHINQFVEDRTLTTSQTATISTLLTFIENHTLDENAETLLQDFQSVWLPNALLVFTKEEVFLLAFSLYDNVDDDHEGLVNANGGGGGTGTNNPLKKCQCEIGSSFWACAMHPIQCTNITCLHTTSCGFLLMSECDGRCDVTKG